MHIIDTEEGGRDKFVHDAHLDQMGPKNNGRATIQSSKQADDILKLFRGASMVAPE